MPTHPDWLSLDADETVVWRGGPRIRRILPTVVKASVWVVLLAVAVVDGPRLVGGPFRLLSTPLLVGGTVVLALPAVAAVVVAYLRTTSVDYVLTDRNAYRKAGVLSTHVSRIGLSTVQRTSLSKDFWGSTFDYGTISISTAGSDGVDLRFADLDDPEPVRERLRGLAGARRSRADDGGVPIDSATADAMLAEFRGLASSARRLERAVSDR